MECPICQNKMRRFGKNRNGSQRFRCDVCRRTFTQQRVRPIGSMRIALEQAVNVLRMLLEGNSIRSTERLTGINRNTIMSLLVRAGRRCQTFMEQTIRRLPVADIQADEVWGFIGMKEKTRKRKSRSELFGDAYCFTALDRTTKLLVAWHLGKRSPEDTLEFAEKLRRATVPHFQLTTDGYGPYSTMIPYVFGSRLDFAQLVKVYGTPSEEEQRRYSPAKIVETYSITQTGNPDKELICTSHVERSNLSIRMAIRRMTRLTNAFSKKWANHEAALALFFAYYNWCRSHMTLTKREKIATTPAMAAGLTDHVWSVRELLESCARVAA